MGRESTSAVRLAGRKFWKAHVRSWRKSGLSRAEYCRQHDLSYHALRYWLRRLDQQTPTGISLVPVPVEKTHHLLERGNNHNSLTLKLEVGQGFKIEVSDGFSPVTLKRLISTLADC